MEEKILGKITKACFGFGGYQDGMIGLSLTFSAKNTGCCTFIGQWAIKRSDYAKWTEEDRLFGLGKDVMRIADILKQAKKSDVKDLVGVPVELTFEGCLLKDWRILTEVIL